MSKSTTDVVAPWMMGLACVLVVMLGAGTAWAQDSDEPTRGVFEFKLGPYTPQVDEAFGNGGPYAQFFGDKSMLYGEFAYERNLWQQVGTLAVGAHIGYGRVSSPVVDDNNEVLDPEETATLRLTPLRMSAIYRYDYSARNHGIPLVPVAKLGLNYYLWRVIDAGGDTAESENGGRGSGGMLGWHATLGLHLDLGIFDPRREASMNVNWGIASTYLFAEYTFSRTGLFSDSIDLSANHWAAGLAFEF